MAQREDEMANGRASIEWIEKAREDYDKFERRDIDRAGREFLLRCIVAVEMDV